MADGYQYPPEKYSPIPISTTASDPHLEELSKKDMALKKRIRHLRYITRSFALVLSLAVLASMIYTMVRWNQTKDLTAQTGTRAWPKNARTWPTIVMLVAALTAVIINFSVLLAYFVSHKASNKVSTLGTVISIMFFIVQTGIWISSLGIWKTLQKTGNNRDIWTYTCSTVADQVQKEFNLSQINFDIFCRSNTASFWIVVAQIVLELTAIFIYALSFIRLTTKLRVKRINTNVEK